MEIIARITTDFPEKFGIPRQSGLADTVGRIVFEPAYRNPDAVKGLEEFDYIWLLWEFEGTEREHWSATVRPPRLGGNQTMGVFATRSPFRPNPIGLSSVRLEKIEMTEDGPVLIVHGADLRDRTPIYDIKPYLPYADSHPEARGGFAGQVLDYELEVIFPEELLIKINPEKRNGAVEILKQDPRPSYHTDPERIYGVAYADRNIRFRVEDRKLTVISVEKR